MRPVKVIGIVAVWAVPAMVGFGLHQPVQTQSGPQEAPTGFSTDDNGFAAEFCANQAALAAVSAISPRIPDDECSLETAIEEFTGPEDTAAGLGPIFNGNGCGATPKGLPYGPCGLCAIPDFQRIGVSSLKIVGREASPFKKLASVKMVRDIVDRARSGAPRLHVIERAKSLREAPEHCASGFMCYYKVDKTQ